MIPAVVPPQQPQSPTIDQLREALRAADTTIGTLRNDLDGLARGRKYRDLKAQAEALARAGEQAARHQELLDRLQTEEWERKRKGG